MRITIDHIGAGGDGVAFTGEQEKIFVPFGAVGDVLDVTVTDEKAKYKSAVINEIIEPSEHRAKPICQHYGTCGGCRLQHITQEYYKDFQEQHVRKTLQQRGFEDIEVAAVSLSPLKSRRRARFNAVKNSKKLTLGFSERAKNKLFDLKECPVMKEDIISLLPSLRRFLEKILAQDQKMAVQVTLCENGFDIVLESKGEPDLSLRMEIAGFADENDIARISWFDTSLKKPQYERLCERRMPFVYFGSRKIMIPPGSFLQATKEGEAALSRAALSFLKDCVNIVDIFAGCGTFGVAALSRLNVHAVEYSKEMSNALLSSTNLLKNAKELTTEIRDLYVRPLNEFELSKFDGAIIDPPRAGAKAQIEEVVRSSLKKLVMISCNPATFARDARLLVDAGFTMEKIKPIDQFLFSPHLEIAACFERKAEKTYDNVADW